MHQMGSVVQFEPKASGAAAVSEPTAILAEECATLDSIEFRIETAAPAEDDAQSRTPKPREDPQVRVS